MIAFNLLRHATLRQLPFLGICGLLLGLFQFMICAAVSSANVGPALETMIRSLPPALQNVLTSQFGGLSERGLLAFGWNHPIAQALGTAVAIVLAARAVAGEIESGAVEFLLGQPLSRTTYFATHVAFALTALASMSLIAMAGTWIGLGVFHKPLFGAQQLLAVALNYFLLQSAWFGLTLLFSVHGHEGGRIAGIGFLIALGSYFGQVVGRLWSDAAFVLPWTLHQYFSPQAILLEGAPVTTSIATLGAVTIVGIGLAAWRFQHRDLP